MYPVSLPMNPKHTAGNDTYRHKSNGGSSAVRKDFAILTKDEKREVLKTARGYRKLLEDHDILSAETGNDASQERGERIGAMGLCPCLDKPLSYEGDIKFWRV